MGYDTLLLTYIINSGPMTDTLTWDSKTARLAPSLESTLKLPPEVSSDHHDAAKRYLTTAWDCCYRDGGAPFFSARRFMAVSGPPRGTRHV